MKNFALAAASSLLAATGAYAQATDTDTITLEAEVSEFIEITVPGSAFRYQITDPTVAIDSAGTNQKPTFSVLSNVDNWFFEVDFPTFTDPRGNGFEQAQFENANGDIIGGSLHVDFNLGFNNGNNGLCRQFPNGDLGNRDASRCFSNSNPASSTATFAGGQTLGLGAAIDPALSPAGADGIAAPGIYSLVATITVSTR